MSSLRRGIAACIVAAALTAFLAAAPAFAHAILLRSQPADGASVAGPHVDFDLRYNSRVDRRRSRLTLYDSAGHERVLPLQGAGADEGSLWQTLMPKKGDADHLRAAADLEPGAYRLRWQVLATDGHITRGDVQFTVAPPAKK